MPKKSVSTAKPAWMQPVHLEGWPTQPVTSTALKYSLPICSRWSLSPAQQQTPMEQEHIYTGSLTGELLTVSYMPQVNPEHDLRNWVQAFIQLTGLPSIHLKQVSEPTPQLLEWRAQLVNDELRSHLAVDELHLYQGLAQSSNVPASYIRLYTLLLRRQTQAWKVHLSFASACPPNAPEELVERNDHVRAAASLGWFRLLLSS